MSDSSDPTLQPDMPAVGTIWQHYKGAFYRVLGHVQLEATNSQAVRYSPTHGPDTNLEWVRDLADWHTYVPGKGRRFVEREPTSVRLTGPVETKDDVGPYHWVRLKGADRGPEIMRLGWSSSGARVWLDCADWWAIDAVDVLSPRLVWKGDIAR